MKREELLAEIDSLNDSCSMVDKLTTVIRAVVELHESFDFTWGGESFTSCKCGEMYPCPTIQAIEKELG